MIQGNKDVLFYSRFCQYSKDVINHIIKKDMKNMFVFVCVDTNKGKLPPQVDRVPALYLTKEGRLLFEDNIIECINSFDEDISPLEQPSSAFSDNFSFISDDTMIQNSSTVAKNFAIFGQEQRIHCPDEDSGKGDNEHSLERYTNQRENDMKSLFSDRR